MDIRGVAFLATHAICPIAFMGVKIQQVANGHGFIHGWGSKKECLTKKRFKKVQSQSNEPLVTKDLRIAILFVVIFIFS